MDDETRRWTAWGLAAVVVAASIGMAGVALIIGSLAADAMVGNQSGVGPTLIFATVVAILATVTGLTIREILNRLFHHPHARDRSAGGLSPKQHGTAS